MKHWLIMLAAVAGCDGGHDLGDIDQTIGAACSTDRDCEVRCYRDNEFPGGFCSLPCESDQECPADSFCMSTSGGVCMFACPQFDCSRLGPAYECRDRNRFGGGGANVCSGN